MKINEGMRPDDLVGMVRAVVSVDCFQSKIDEQAIVLAFSVSDRTAADDVNRFIQKSYVDLLDTEVSAAPDQKGFYLVFVEMVNDDKLAKGIADLCGDLSALCAIEKWVVEVRGNEPTPGLKANEIEAAVNEKMGRHLEEFFLRSSLDHVVLNENVWTVGKGNSQLSFTVDDFGTLSEVTARNNLHRVNLDESANSSNLCAEVCAMFGAGWSVQKLDEMFALYHESTDQLLLIQPLGL